MEDNEQKVRGIIAPYKIKYHPKTTEEFAERAFARSHYLAAHQIELLDHIKELQKRIDTLEKCALWKQSL
jgi:hypothetical protein